MYREKLLGLGIPADIRGFEYLNCAIKIYTPAQKIMALYEAVASQFKTIPQRVERCMRVAVEHSGENITVGQFVAKYKILWKDEVENEV